MKARIIIAVVAGIALGLLALVGVLARVDNELTREDQHAIGEFLAGMPDRVTLGDYESELAFITAAQDAVLTRAGKTLLIELGETREPADLLGAGGGLCYDRSRSIEKILRSRDFETRHLFIYARGDSGFTLGTLLTPGVPSHAVTEVRTARGWLVVDSNARWLSLDESGDPVAIEHFGPAKWAPAMDATRNAIFDAPFGFVYGLYSRHGRFYPPFTAVPDINWAEFANNF